MRALTSLCVLMMLLAWPRMTAGRDKVVCVKTVQKSCADVYGAWPGPGNGPPSDCKFKDCVDNYTCVSGEVAVLYWVKSQADWSVTVETHVPPLSGEVGELRKDSEVSTTCKYQDVCDYDCVIEPIGGGRHCKTMNREDTDIMRLETVVGVCTGEPDF